MLTLGNLFLAAPPRFKIVEIQQPPAVKQTLPNGGFRLMVSPGAKALNDRGEVAGTNGSAAYLWKNGHTTTIRSASEGNFEPCGINNRGQMGGTQFGTYTTPVIWSNGRFIRLQSAGAKQMNGRALAINDAGQVVGWTATESTTQTEHPAEMKPCIWDPKTGLQIIGIPTSSHPHLQRPRMESRSNMFPSAVTLNSNGEVVVSGQIDPFKWRRGATTILEAPSPDSKFWDSLSRADGINSQGDVCGCMFKPINPPKQNRLAQDVAVIWSKGRIRQLGNGFATAINNSGDVVGYAWITGPDGKSTQEPYLWSKQGNLQLNDLLPKGSKYRIWEVRAINNRGEILCNCEEIGSGPNGRVKPILLVPVRSERH